MKSDFRGFRWVRRWTLALLAVAAFAFVGCSALVGGEMGVIVGLVSFVVLGMAGFICECAAYDCLICPHCGKLSVKPHREFPTDKENAERFRAIRKGRPFSCVNCGRTIETHSESGDSQSCTCGHENRTH